MRNRLRRALVYGLAGLLSVGGGLAAHLRPSNDTERPVDLALIHDLAEEARRERRRRLERLEARGD